MKTVKEVDRMAQPNSQVRPDSPAAAFLHQRCHFDVLPHSHPTSSWPEIIKTIRQWVVYAVQTEEKLLGAWFFKGGDWFGAKSPRVSLRVVTEQGDGAIECPQFWTLRYEHPCREVTARQWRVDIGVTLLSDRLRFSAATSYWLLSEYIGPEPEQPVPTAPSVVRSLLKGRGWSCMAGTERLSEKPRVIRVGDGQLLYERLVDLKRGCPVVVVSRNQADGNPVLDADSLAKTLAGSAVVYVADSPDVEEEWEYFLPKGFRCRNGMVRVYQPHVDFSSERDAKRHRYFSEEQIKEHTEARVREMIVRGITRRASAIGHSEVTSIEDVEARRRDNRLRELRRIADDKSKDEYIHLLEEDNNSLRSSADDLRSRLSAADAQIEDLQDKVEELDDQKRRLEYDLQAAACSRQAAEEGLRRAERQSQTLFSLKRLPSSVKEVAETIQQLFPAELVFTPRGLKSTEDRGRDVVEVAWECLYAMATVLHPLLFDAPDENIDLERVFKEKTGFDLGMSEGRSTKRDKKFMKLRQDVFDGRTIEIIPHIKVGNKEPRLLRVHFFVDNDERRIVIGHCGGHLDNFSTRRQ
jgi:hypothetical protein